MPKINWKEYNEKLEFIENWKKELKEMNEKKRGHPYGYPNSYMQFLFLSDTTATSTTEH